MNQPLNQKSCAGLTIPRYFTGSGKKRLSSTVWGRRKAIVHTNPGIPGLIMRTCEAPDDWSQGALDMAVTNYFTNRHSADQPIASIRWLVEHVTTTIANHGFKAALFKTHRDSEIFQKELACACFNRYGWFGKLVWRNLGIPQLSTEQKKQQITKAYEQTRLETQSKQALPPFISIHASKALVQDRKRLQKAALKIRTSGAATIHFDDIISAWHTCPASGPAVGVTPSSGYLFINESACNLATINVNRFIDKKGHLDIGALRHVVSIFTIALDILVDISNYADRNTARNSRAHRPIGLSYAGLAPLLMRMGIPYDSDSGRAYAAALTSFITATACATSQKLALAAKPFSKYKANQASMLAVVHRHAKASAAIKATGTAIELHAAAQKTWEQVIKTTPATGFRNAQFTLLAAAGLGGIMTDSETSDIGAMMASLDKYTRMNVEAIHHMVNPCVNQALTVLGYPAAVRRAIQIHILDRQTIKGAPGLKQEHLPVFDGDGVTSSSKHRTRAISIGAQLKMMAAVQPLISGCISRSIILPSTASAKQIAELIMNAYKLGIRTLRIYRNGIKRTNICQK